MSVLIISTDTDYCSAVAKYFKMHYLDEILIVTCSSLSNINEYIKNNNISIILAEEEFYNDAAASAGKCVVYKLVESKEAGDNNAVCKYISAPSLYNELLFIYSKCTADEGGSFNTAGNLVAFISVNGCGSTTLSVAYAKRLAQAGKKVLYIGLDGLSDYCSIFSVEQNRCLSDIILALKSKSSNVSMVAKAATHQGEVCFIDKCRRSDDIYEIDDEETSALFSKLISSDNYDAVVADISFAYMNLWKYVAKNAGHIFCVTTNRTSSIAKTNNFIETVEFRDYSNGTEAFSNMSIIVNRSSSNQPVAPIECEKLAFIPRSSAEDYSGLTEKISKEDAWKEFI